MTRAFPLARVAPVQIASISSGTRLRTSHGAAGNRRSGRALFTAILATSSLLGAVACGCQPKRQIPQESWLVVTSPAAPMLGELEDDDPPQEVLRRGELIRITKEMRPFHWDATMDGKPDERKGLAVELKYAEEGLRGYGFKEDFGEEASVPATPWLCEELSGQGPFDKARCPALLRRARTADGALVLYAACSTGTCPVAVFKDDKLTVTPIDSLTSATFYQGKKRSLLIAATRWVKDEGRQSGGAIVPLVIEGGAVTKHPEIPTDSVDSRDPAGMKARLVRVTLTPGQIQIAGEETVKKADGTTLSTKPLDEKHPLPSLD